MIMIFKNRIYKQLIFLLMFLIDYDILCSHFKCIVYFFNFLCFNVYFLESNEKCNIL